MKGFTTIHAGSARQALTRLRFICQLADTSSELSLPALNSLVSEAVDVVVHCTRTGDRVRVSEVVAVEDLQTGRDSSAFTVTELFRRETAGAPLTWTGNLPARAARPLEMAGYDVRHLLDASAAPFGPPPAPAPVRSEPAPPPATQSDPGPVAAGTRVRARRLGRQLSR
ncbi:MAG: hypothetical protein ACT4PX_03355 [Actinomycetota bacterium]